MNDETSAIQAEYARQGYVCVKNLVDRARVFALRSYVEQQLAGHALPYAQRVYDAQGHTKLIKVSGLVDLDREFRSLASERAVTDVVEALVGEGARRFRDVLIVKPARTGGRLSYHQDSAYWDVEPMELVSAWIALGDVPVDGSCLQVVPGSHGELAEHGLYLNGRRAVPRPIVTGLRRLVSLSGTGDRPQREATGALAWNLKRAVLARATRYAPFLFDLQDYRIAPSALIGREQRELPVQAGDVVFFHSLLWHASGPNRTADARYAAIISFMSPNARYTGVGAPTFPVARVGA